MFRRPSYSLTSHFIQICRTNLPPHNQSDPVVSARIGNGKKVFTTTKRKTKNPVWNETISLSLPASFAREPLVLTVYHAAAVIGHLGARADMGQVG
jgi:hypothetical protein